MKIEQALYENIYFIWFSGQSKLDHNAINDFRDKRLQRHLKKNILSSCSLASRRRCSQEKTALLGCRGDFCNIKRFMLEGDDKVNVEIEIGFIAIVHNLKKFSLNKAT